MNEHSFPTLHFITQSCYLLLPCNIPCIYSRAQHFTGSTDLNLSKLWELVTDREVWHAAVYGVTKSQTQLRDWTELNLSLVPASIQPAPFLPFLIIENIFSYFPQQHLLSLVPHVALKRHTVLYVSPSVPVCLTSQLLVWVCLAPQTPWGQTSCILLLCNPRTHNNNNSQKHSLSVYHVPNTVLLSSIFLFNLNNNPKRFSLVQSLSHVRLFETPWTVARQVSLSITSSQSLLKLMSIAFVMPSNHLILCHPLLLLPSIFPSIRVFSNESVFRIRWSKISSFSFSISPSNEYSGLISFRMDCLDFLAVQGTLKSLLQHHTSKASILQHSAFFTVQLSHPYMTSGKTIALTRQTFVGKVTSLLLNKLSRLVVDFLPKSKRLLISWLQSTSAVILEPKIIKSATISPSICHEMMGLDAMILVFWMLSFKPTFSLSSFTSTKRLFLFSLWMLSWFSFYLWSSAP